MKRWYTSPMHHGEQKKEHVLKVLLILIWILALIHMIAEYYYLYWIFRWFDMVTHFLGGVWLGVAGLWVWFYSGYIRKPSLPEKNIFLIALLSGVLIGIVWELFEYGVWQWSGSGLPANYYGDTVLDLCVDILGALMGAHLFTYLHKKCA